MIQIKRAYVAPAPSDGYRILVDRLWPRGVSKTNLKLAEWAKEVAPSAELRKWFDHDATKFTEFKQRYQVELRQNPAWPAFCQRVQQQPVVTLVYGAKDEQHNQAVVLATRLQALDN